MNSFNPQSFSFAIKQLAPNHSKFTKEAISLVSLITYEINNDLVNNCLQNNGSVRDITVKHIRESIKNSIPGDLRKYAFAQANSTIAKYRSGLINYKGPKIQKEKNIGLDTRTVRKCLEEINNVLNSGLRLSKNCSAFVKIIQMLATELAEKAVETSGNKSEISLTDMRKVVSNLLGEEMFQHSAGHSESNLAWYRCGDLDFTIKPLTTEVVETVSDDTNNLWGKCVQKIFKSKNSQPISREVEKMFEKILNDLMKKILDEIKFVFQQGIDNVSNESVAEEHIVQATRTLLPEPLYKLALCSAEQKLLNYKCGILKYSFDRKEKEEPTSKEERIDPRIVPDFRKGVRHIMKMINCSYSRGFLPIMNEILNDIGSKIVGRSFESVRGNSDILSENDIINAVNDLLPNQLKDHALARITQIQCELGQQCIQLTANISSNVIQSAGVRTEDHYMSNLQEYNGSSDIQPTDFPVNNFSNVIEPTKDKSEEHQMSNHLENISSNAIQPASVRSEEQHMNNQPTTSSSSVIQPEEVRTDKQPVSKVPTNTFPNNNQPTDVSTEEYLTTLNIISNEENDYSSHYEHVLLDIPKKIYWLDVRPYEILT